MKGGILAWAVRGVGDLFKGYVAIIAIVLVVAGASAAASIAGTIAVAGGTALGIGVGNIGPFASSVTNGTHLVKTPPPPKTAAPSGKSGGGSNSLTKKGQ